MWETLGEEELAQKARLFLVQVARCTHRSLTGWKHQCEHHISLTQGHMCSGEDQILPGPVGVCQ
jgi:hypothetical protein